jgi:phytoene dehydrogenase-like protein
MAGTGQVLEGFKGPLCGHLLRGFSTDIVKELRLSRYGFKLSSHKLPTVVLDPDGRNLVLTGDAKHDAQALAAVSNHDPANYARFMDRMAGHAAALKPLFEIGPSGQPLAGPSNQLGALERIAGTLKLRQAQDLLRVAEMSIGDLLDDSFDHPTLKALFAVDALAGAPAGAYAPMTALPLLLEMAARGRGSITGYPEGGLGGLAEALRKAAVDKGASIRTNSKVARINVDQGRAMSVELVTGEILSAPLIISSLDPHTTFLELVGARHLDTSLVSRLRRNKPTGRVGKITLALSSLPTINGLSPELISGRTIIAPSLAERDAAAATAAREDFGAMAIELFFPSIHDPMLTPMGQHVMSAIVYDMPYEPEGGWPLHRANWVKLVIDMIARFAPDISEHLLSGSMLTPADIAHDYGAPGGHWHHGDVTLARVLTSGVETQVAGLYLCGSGAAPVGGVTGIPGRNAARAILAVKPVR